MVVGIEIPQNKTREIKLGIQAQLNLLIEVGQEKSRVEDQVTLFVYWPTVMRLRLTRSWLGHFDTKFNVTPT